MKIKRVFANNRKRNFSIQTSRGIMAYPYSRLAIKPSQVDPIVSVYTDPELGHEGVTVILRSGAQDTIHVDHVLDYNRDPEYLCELMLHNLTVKALEAIKESEITRRELARRLKTSPKQIYRLLDPTFYGKTINQMIKLLHVLGQSVSIVTGKKRAA